MIVLSRLPIFLFSFFLNPAIVQFFAVAFVCYFYSVDISDHFFHSLFVFLLGVIGSLFYYFAFIDFSKRLNREGANVIFLSLDGFFWNAYGVLIIFLLFVEIFYFGLPLLGGTNYASFGFPFLHHIVVSSWILLFIRCNQFLNVIFRFFAVATPFLIVNRDLFLLTFFMLFFNFLISGRLSIFRILLVVIFVGILFGAIGVLRSGAAQLYIDLPISFDYSEMNPLLFWVFIYFTSSTFNILYSLPFGGVVLYDPLINVVPEYGRYLIDYDYFGFYFFYFTGTVVLLVTYLLRERLTPFVFIFFIYQVLMASVFADKLFVSHSFFILCLFALFGLANMIISRNKF